MNKSEPSKTVTVHQHPDHGVVLSCLGLEVADQFEDYLTERLDVPFMLGFEGECASFYVGKNTSTLHVTQLFEQFQKEATAE